MRGMIRWASLLIALMLALAGAALADGEAKDDELAAVDEYALGEIAVLGAASDDSEGQILSHLRAAFRFDVEQARSVLADSEQLERFEQAYGKYARIYVLEYASAMEGMLPVAQYVAVGVDAEGSMAQVMTLDMLAKSIYVPAWYADVDMELVYDVTLEEAGAV